MGAPNPEWIIYHDPQCGKSRTTLEILESHGIDPLVVRLRTQGIDRPTLVELLKKLRVAPKAILRINHPTVRTLGLADRDDVTIIEAMLEHPELIDRPIVVRGHRAVLCRPPARVALLLDESVEP